MKVTASALRANVYRLLDQAIATGLPIEVERKGVTLKIVAEKPVSKLSRLKKREAFEGNPDDILTMDWSQEWTELK